MDGGAPRFGTLGTEGSNHSMVLRRYIEFRGLHGAEVVLFTAFRDAFDALAAGGIDFLLQVSVHPEHSALAARYLNRAHIVDTFISPSKVLAVVTRRGLDAPRSIAFQPATRHYVDMSRWSRHVDEISIMTVAEGLLDGRYDSGITAAEIAERHPDRFQIDELIGAVVDAWVLFGRRRLPDDRLVAWRDAPVTEQFALLSRSGR